ncbi:hypothetical protein BJI67_15895 (plasmid) [Acidihalobacter aeolianus]|uniref:Uncharacterized protein n=2 Tax=Acidihalobacter aeolianus TaxID=2792603 RepID=A0A1D8KCP4_9GAMM|nr:hypothetical protein BJI67_15895 [Acidihalobacter aeolianus]
MSIANALIKNSSFVAGQLRIFGGTNDECKFITSGALSTITTLSAILTLVLTIFTAGGYAAAAGIVSAYGVSVLSTMKCCNTNPSQINPANGLCTLSDVRLSYAREKNLAVRVDGAGNVGGSPADSGTGAADDCLDAPGAGIGPTGPIVISTNTSCAITDYVQQNVLISQQSWCYFPNFLSKTVQVQGRAQLQQLLTANAAGAISSPLAAAYYGSSAGAGDWTTPISVNGNLVSMWQWAGECSSPATSPAGDLNGICPTQNSAWLAICSAGTSCPASPGGNPNFSGPNTLNNGNVGWTFVPIDSTSTTPATLNRFALAQGQCSGTGTADMCNYTVHAWKAGIGGTLHAALKLKWPEAYPATTGFNSDFTSTSPMGDNIVLEAYTYNDSNGQPASMSPIVRYSLNGGSTWSGPITLPTNQPSMNYALPGGPASPAMTVYGGCQQGMCNYTFSYQVNVTTKPWGYYTWNEQRNCALWAPPVSLLGACIANCGSYWVDETCNSNTGCTVTNSTTGSCLFGQTTQSYGYVWHPDCSGFTLPQIESMDFSKMDFSAYLASLSPQNPASSLATTTATVNSAQTRAAALQSGAPVNGYLNKNQRTFTISPANGVWPGTPVTLTANTSYVLTQNNTSQVLPVTQIDVNWGDGSTSSQLVTTQTQLDFSHKYGSLGCPSSPPTTSCTPTPSAPTTYPVTVTFHTAQGNFTNDGSILVSTQAPVINPQSNGTQTHGTVGPSTAP